MQRCREEKQAAEPNPRQPRSNGGADADLDFVKKTFWATFEREETREKTWKEKLNIWKRRMIEIVPQKNCDKPRSTADNDAVPIRRRRGRLLFERFRPTQPARDRKFQPCIGGTTTNSLLVLNLSTLNISRLLVVYHCPSLNLRELATIPDCWSFKSL